MKTICNIQNLCFSYTGKNEILSDISFSIHEKEIVGILGKNGSGKSTLLDLLAGYLAPQNGKILIDGIKAQDISANERSKIISYIEQKKIKIPSYYTVEEFIIEGRRPFRPFGFYKKEDYELLEEKMKCCNVHEYKNRLLRNLSGGEFQRCVFARAMMKQAKLYLFDEPCSAMDIKYQKDFFKTARKLLETETGSILISIHDINLAVQNCDRIILLSDGKIKYDGNASNISESILSLAFDTPVSSENKDRLSFFYY